MFTSRVRRKVGLSIAERVSAAATSPGEACVMCGTSPRIPALWMRRSIGVLARVVARVERDSGEVMSVRKKDVVGIVAALGGSGAVSRAMIEGVGVWEA